MSALGPERVDPYSLPSGIGGDSTVALDDEIVDLLTKRCSGVDVEDIRDIYGLVIRLCRATSSTPRTHPCPGSSERRPTGRHGRSS